MSNERPIRFSISRLARRRLPEPIVESIVDPASDALARWRTWREAGQIDLAARQGKLKGESIYPSILSSIIRARRERE